LFAVSRFLEIIFYLCNAIIFHLKAIAPLFPRSCELRHHRLLPAANLRADYNKLPLCLAKDLV
ncbi:MAG: hypothetical protein AAFY50_16815, partial [Cyanobacteria bacterium J06648_1]